MNKSTKKSIRPADAVCMGCAYAERRAQRASNQHTMKKPNKQDRQVAQTGMCQSCYFYVNCARRCLVHKRYVAPDYTCSYHTNLTELAQT